MIAVFAAAFSFRGGLLRLPVWMVLANSAGVAAMADPSLAAACTYVDPGAGPLFVPELNPMTWSKPTLHISSHCPVVIYFSSHGWLRFSLAFFLSLTPDHGRCRPSYGPTLCQVITGCSGRAVVGECDRSKPVAKHW